MVKDKLASGISVSEGEVTRDTAVQRRLREAVVPVFDRVASGDEKLIDLKEVFSGLESRYRARKSTR